MARIDNLKGKVHKISVEEASKGGKKSAEVRKAAKLFKEAINENMSDEDLKAMTNKMIGLAKKGNIKAYEILRDTRGEKPKDKIEANLDVSYEEALKEVGANEEY